MNLIADLSTWIAKNPELLSYGLAVIVIGGPILMLGVVLYDHRQVGKMFDEDKNDL